MRIHPMKFICVGAICALSASCRGVQSAPPDAAAIARITAAAPSKAAAKPSRARRLLVFTRAAGFRHSSIETGREAMSIVGKKTGAWTTIVSDDPIVFERANLARFDAVCFLNTTGEVFLPANFDQLSSPEQTSAKEREARWKKSLLDFVAGGKGFVGIHAATDTFYNWPEYGAMIGGYFDGHPWNAGDDISLRVEDPSHPIVAALKGENLSFKEEYYQFRAPYSRQNGRVLLGLDLSQTAPRDGMKRTDGDYASTWIRRFGKGRVFYSSLGHREEIYADAKVLSVYLAGIQWAMGDLQADASPLAFVANDATDAAGEYGFGNTRNTKISFLTRIPTIGSLFKPKPPTIAVRIIAEGDGNYRAFFNSNAIRIVPLNRTGGGLQQPVKAPEKLIEMTGQMKDGAIDFSGKDGDLEYKARWTEQSLALSLPNSTQPIVLKKVNRTSPMLNQKPRDAIALLPIEADGGPNLDAWTNNKWLRMRDGSMRVFGGDNRTKAEFGDANIHLEWMTPLRADKRGRERGNSAILIQDRYEVQICDSFGLDVQAINAGDISQIVRLKADAALSYRIARPKVNASLPPGQWQSYDITFRAARLSADGRVARDATMSVLHNGILIHDNVALKLSQSTFRAVSNDLISRAPLLLQDHGGGAVRFRNIWVQELADQTPLAAANSKTKTKTLFNGVNLEGWIAKKGEGPKVENGAIHITPGSGDIWTKEQFGDFVLDLEYKVSPHGNSGVFIRNPTPGDWFGGMEIQIFDSFGRNPPDVHDAGANYSVMAPSKNMSKPAGEWNAMRIRARGANIQVELNGERVLDQDLNRWTQAGKNPDGTANKFKKAYKDMPRVGHIELQDHGEEVWFRNIKIKELR